MYALLLIGCFDVAADPSSFAKAVKQQSKIDYADIGLLHTDLHAVRLLAGHKSEVI